MIKKVCLNSKFLLYLERLVFQKRGGTLFLHTRKDERIDEEAESILFVGERGYNSKLEC